MLKKPFLLTTTFILSIQQLMAGAGNSTLPDEQEKQQNRREISSLSNEQETLIRDIAVSAGIVSIGAVA